MMKKKLLGMLFLLAMVMMFVPMKVALAGEGNYKTLPENGGELSGTYDDNDDSSPYMILSAGHYKLTGDVTLNKMIMIKKGEIWIDLNGYNLITTIPPKVGITYSCGIDLQGGKLNLRGNGTIMTSNSGIDDELLFIGNGGTVNILDNITITRKNEIANQTAVKIGNDGTLNMYDGKIVGNYKSSDKCSGVYLTGTNSVFNMYGGQITNNAAYKYGCGVYAETGTFNMYGGVIGNNISSQDSSGANIHAQNGEFNWYGGQVINQIGGKTYDSSDSSANLGSDDKEINKNLGITFENKDKTIPLPNVCYMTQKKFGSASIIDRNGICARSFKNQNIKLVEDITLSIGKGYGICIQASLNQNGPVVLDLNGHTITGNNEITGLYTKKDVILIDSKGTGQTGRITGCKIGVSNNNGTFTMYGGEISGNKKGARIYSKFNMYGGTISDNKGIGVDVDSNGSDSGSSLYMYSGTISGNSTGGSGGGVYVGKTDAFYMYGGTINGNHAGKCGGGVYADGILSIENSNIIDNNSDSSGGGMYATNKLYLDNNTISNNSSGYRGGGVCHSSSGKLTVQNCTIEDNKAKSSGGGMYITGQKDPRISSVTLKNNTAGESGGGMYLSEANARFYLENIKITNNTAGTGYGGGLVACDDVDLGRKTIIKDNYVGTEKKDSNLYLYSGYDLLFADNTITEDSRIGISTQKKPTDDSYIGFAMYARKDYDVVFSSDEDYELFYDGYHLALRIPTQSEEDPDDTSGAVTGSAVSGSVTETGSAIGSGSGMMALIIIVIVAIAGVCGGIGVRMSRKKEKSGGGEQ